MGIPRLALMKLEGARRVADSFKAMGSRKNLTMMALSGVLISGAAVAGAAWIGGSLVDAHETIARAADGAAVDMGFGLEAPIDVRGVGDARAAEVRAVALPEGRASLFSATPASVRARVEALPWVEHATVRRLWPGALRIDVTRRQAYALWQHEGAVTVIDAKGAPVRGARWKDYRGLPVVVGAGADETAQPILVTLENMPSIRTRIQALVRIGDRRWNLEMKSGMNVALPEAGAPAALAVLAGLQDQYRLLDRPLARIDLRQPGKMVVLPRDVLAGGPGLADDERRLAAGA
jgi:cell division protein FtsQ